MPLLAITFTTSASHGSTIACHLTILQRTSDRLASAATSTQIGFALSLWLFYCQLSWRFVPVNTIRKLFIVFHTHRIFFILNFRLIFCYTGVHNLYRVSLASVPTIPSDYDTIEHVIKSSCLLSALSTLLKTTNVCV